MKNHTNGQYQWSKELIYAGRKLANNKIVMFLKKTNKKIKYGK